MRRPAWSRRRLDAIVLATTIAAACLVGYVARSLYWDVFSGAPLSIPVALSATCQTAGSLAPCDAAVVPLNPGRFHVRTSAPASSLTLTIRDAAAAARWRVLLVRTEQPATLVVAEDPSAVSSRSFSVSVGATRQRSLIGIPASAAWTRITLIPASPDRPAVVHEIGFFESDRGLLRSATQPLPFISGARFYATYAAAFTLAVCAWMVAAAWAAPSVMNRWGPWLLGCVCFAVCVLEIGTAYSPYWSGDVRSFYGAELVLSGSNGNLTGGLYTGARLIQGLGVTEPPGIVAWHRMPGYGLFCGLAAAVGRTTDPIEIAMVVVVLQMTLYSVGVAAFVAAARPVFGGWMACLLGVLIMLLPKQLHYTQVDSIAAPIALLGLAALLVLIAQEQGGRYHAFRTFVLVNGSLALWFLMRNDVLPGWIVLGFALAGSRWRRVVVPIVLMTAIALPWALYKRQYRHEFNLLPTNTGEVLFLSLCEVPGAFPYECTDAGYFAWAKQFSQSNPASQKTSSLAVAEVVRHWVTYPVHFGFMVWFKLRRSVFGESWPGVRTRLNLLYGGLVREIGLFLVLLAVVIVALAVNHERRRTLLLGWPLFLNLPIFLVVFESNGRFYAAAGVSVLVAAVPLLFERGLYVQVRRHPRRAAAVIACFLLFIAGGRPLEDWIRTHDAVHYWTPLLDPQRSTIAFPPR